MQACVRWFSEAVHWLLRCPVVSSSRTHVVVNARRTWPSGWWPETLRMSDLH